MAIAGDVEVSISGSLSTGREAEIAPAFDQGAAHLAISIGGLDAGQVPAASLGERSRIRALLSAPHGTLALADHTHATGAFAAMDIALGERVRVEFETGLPPRRPGSRAASGSAAITVRIRIRRSPR